jgi:hypothetical protein
MTSIEVDALSDEQRVVVEKIYELFRERGEWPKYGDVYRPLRRAHRFIIGAVYKSISDAYIQPFRPVPTEPHADELARLTLRGIETCPEGAEDSDRFVRLLRWLAEIERDYEPAPGQPVEPAVTATQVRDHLGIKQGDDVALGRLFTMLSIDNWGVTGNGYTTLVDWYINVHPEIYRFADVENVEDCLRVRADWVTEANAVVMIPRPALLGRPLTAANYSYVPAEEPGAEPVSAEITSYADEKIVDALRSKTANGKFDLTKLLALIDELNENYANENTYACLALIRAIMDHVPPILGCKNFEEVASSYPGWRSSSKSNRVSTNQSYMQNLLTYKKNGDDAMHRPASPHEDLLTMADVPSRVWVNVLLRECAAKL